MLDYQHPRTLFDIMSNMQLPTNVILLKVTAKKYLKKLQYISVIPTDYLRSLVQKRNRLHHLSQSAL